MKYQKITNVSKNSQQNIQGQLQMRMIKKYLKKYLKKDIYLQKKDKKLLIILILI